MLSFDEVVKLYITELFKQTRGNKSSMVRHSGLSRATIYRLLAKYDIKKHHPEMN